MMYNVRTLYLTKHTNTIHIMHKRAFNPHCIICRSSFLSPIHPSIMAQHVKVSFTREKRRNQNWTKAGPKHKQQASQTLSLSFRIMFFPIQKRTHEKKWVYVFKIVGSRCKRINRLRSSHVTHIYMQLYYIWFAFFDHPSRIWA